MYGIKGKGIHRTKKIQKIKHGHLKVSVWEATGQIMVVQSVNLTECGELVRDLTIDAQEFDSRSVKRQSEMGNNTWVSEIKIVEIIPRWEKRVVFT